MQKASTPNSARVRGFVIFCSGVVGPKNSCVGNTLLWLHTGCQKKLQKKVQQKRDLGIDRWVN